MPERGIEQQHHAVRLECHEGGKSASVLLSTYGAQVAEFRIGTGTDMHNVLFPRQKLRTIGSDLDSTGEGGSFPAWPFGRSDKWPIHGPAALLSPWATVAHSEHDATMQIHLRTGADHKNFVNTFGPERKYQVDRFIELVPSTETDESHHLRMTTSLTFQGPAERGPLEQLGEHPYLEVDYKKAKIYARQPDGSYKPMLLSSFEELVRTEDGLQRKLDKRFPLGMFENEEGMIRLLPDGDESNMVIVQTHVTSNLEQPISRELVLFHKMDSEGERTSICIEPLAGTREHPISLRQGDWVAQQVDIFTRATSQLAA